MRNGNTKKIGRINKETLLVTIDMGKAKHTGYYRFPDGVEGKIFEFSNNRDGFEEMWQRVCYAQRSRNLTKIVVGFESTGPYAEPLLHFLRKRDVGLVQVNPFHTKRLKELQGNSPSKTDQKDPKVIADIIELGHALTVIIPEGTAAQLRRLTQARERGIQRKRMLMSQVQDLVFLIFPEFMPVMKDLTIKSTPYVLKHYPRPQDIVETGVTRLTQSLKEVSRGKLGKERAQALYQAAEVSVGLKEGQDSMVIEIRELISAIESIQRYVKELEMHMGKHLKEIPYSGFILSIKGIGEITAAGLIGEVGDFRGYRTIAELIHHAGLDLFEISSGKHKGKRRISKRGRPLLRKLLFFASIRVVRKGGILRRQYLHHLNKGMPKIKALIAISRKLLTIIFALVRDHSMYRVQHSEIQSLKEAA
jgi:transposase